jgi:HEPN superfamily AbiU2-like protein
LIFFFQEGNFAVLQEKIAKLEAEVDSLLTLTIRANERFLFLRPMLANLPLNDRIQSEGKLPGFDRLRNWLYWGFIQELIKICSDNDPRTPCIAKIREQLQDAGTLKALEDKYSKSNREMATEAELRSEFKRIYRRFKDQSEEILSSTAAASYKRIRDKLISHNELKKSGDEYSFLDIKPEKLKYGDEGKLLEKTRAAVDDLLTLVRNVDFSWQGSFDIATRAVCSFWEIESIESERKPES